MGTTPKTVTSEITKTYPSQSQKQTIKPVKVNKLDKYKPVVPTWFDNLSKPVDDTPVIQIPGGDTTPGSESGEYELNVPMLNSELSDVSKKQPKDNGLSLNLNGNSLNSNASDNDKEEQNEQKEE